MDLQSFEAEIFFLFVQMAFVHRLAEGVDLSKAGTPAHSLIWAARGAD